MGSPGGYAKSGRKEPAPGAHGSALTAALRKARRRRAVNSRLTQGRLTPAAERGLGAANKGQGRGRAGGGQLKTGLWGGREAEPWAAPGLGGCQHGPGSLGSGSGPGEPGSGSLGGQEGGECFGVPLSASGLASVGDRQKERGHPPSDCCDVGFFSDKRGLGPVEAPPGSTPWRQHPEKGGQQAGG